MGSGLGMGSPPTMSHGTAYASAWAFVDSTLGGPSISRYGCRLPANNVAEGRYAAPDIRVVGIGLVDPIW